MVIFLSLLIISLALTLQISANEAVIFPGIILAFQRKMLKVAVSEVVIVPDKIIIMCHRFFFN